MKKLIFILMSIFFVMSCDQSSGDPAPANEPYVGTWSNKEATPQTGQTTYTLTNTTYSADVEGYGPTTGTVAKKDGEDGILIINTLTYQSIPVSIFKSQFPTQYQGLVDFGLIFENGEVSWSVNGDTLTVEGTSFTRQ